ncbi:MAG: hypothetical protein K6B44_02545 [Lachnospiraceae bacterium]|nr:hypothetical protein [Lachnospiraceae bacterium]
MRKQFKRVLSIIICVVMLAGMVPEALLSTIGNDMYELRAEGENPGEEEPLIAEESVEDEPTVVEEQVGEDRSKPRAGRVRETLIGFTDILLLIVHFL